MIELRWQVTQGRPREGSISRGGNVWMTLQWRYPGRLSNPGIIGPGSKPIPPTEWVDVPIDFEIKPA